MTKGGQMTTQRFLAIQGVAYSQGRYTRMGHTVSLSQYGLFAEESSMHNATLIKDFGRNERSAKVYLIESRLTQTNFTFFKS